ncbi:MAG: hypothetical protein HZB39_21180, partial [Planctomycetes bacterium]|nr:hypothetical protein [Planctomycetota bacterium]
LGTGTNNIVYALARLPNGDLIAGGAFGTAGGVIASCIALWNGSTWSPLGTGTDNSVYALAALPNGDFVAGGVFTIVDGKPALYFARHLACPATAIPYGIGCTGSGGPNVLTAITLPWVGGTFRATATGMPSSLLALSMTGFSQVAIPLASLLPQGVPGCDLLASPDFADVIATSGGTAQFQLVLPNSASLVGAQFFHQVVPVELDQSLALTAVTSTNALAMTIGSL